VGDFPELEVLNCFNNQIVAVQNNLCDMLPLLRVLNLG
jgi:hypothetical protein